MYYVFYFTITVLCAVISKLFYCILLTDVIKRSEDLMGLLKALTYNYKKLLKAFFLIIICIYSWSLVGLLLFEPHYERNTEGVDYSEKDLYVVFSVSILKGLLSYGGVHDILEF